MTPPLPSFATGLSVLVAEDNPVNALVPRQQLSSLGLACMLAPDGEQAATAGHAAWSAVLTDCEMPVLDG